MVRNWLNFQSSASCPQEGAENLCRRLPAFASQPPGSRILCLELDSKEINHRQSACFSSVKIADLSRWARDPREIRQSRNTCKVLEEAGFVAHRVVRLERILLDEALSA